MGITQVRLLISSLLLLLISGCGTPTFWKLDGISAGDAAFDSTRLRFVNPDHESPIAFEFLRTGDEIQAYLNLNQFSWRPSKKDPSSISVEFIIGNEKILESVALLEGRMRIRLPHEITERITIALQQGQKVAILADGFEATLDPDQFSREFNRFLGKRALFQLFKGPIE